MSELTIKEQLVEDIVAFRHDPLGYVLYAFTWGEGELSDESGPEDWQIETLNDIGQGLRNGELTVQQAIQIAIASGHGIGKSTMVAWVILWGLSTFEDTRIVITANTDGQLSTKTWPEVAKWHRRSINRDWFTYTATSLYSAEPGHEKNWRADAIPWSVHNTEAFAGLHNAKKRIILIFDEASAIDDKIWEVAEGALTDEDTEIVWLAFGNPTRNTGRFKQCFGSLKHRWITKQIDSRTVRRTNKVQLQKWVDDYGEDSDFVRTRVTGKFPRASSMQLFSTDLVAEAMRREARSTLLDPLIMALDIARGGDDNCVIRFRRGLDARSIPPIVIPGSEVKDSMRLVSKVVQVLEEKKPDAFFYDGTGGGGPVGDRVRQLGFTVMEVQFGAGSPNPKQANFRAFMYQKALDWLNAGGALDANNELETDLTSIQYSHNKKDQMILESKEDMKKRGLASPDHGDSFVMTFAYPVAPKMLGQSSQRSNADFDPYDESRRNH